MSKFRLVILDDAKEQLDNPVAKKILSDIVFIKQKNFLRTDPNYVVTDKHDMIGTHYLVYDTTELLEPKLVFAIRTTFLSRSQQHGIDTPLLSLIPKLEPSLQAAFRAFQDKHPELVDCNAWFVDPAYSKKNSGLNLSDLGYYMVCTHILRAGSDHFIGCTNETYNASRWLEYVGTMPKGLLFEHPAVKAPHRMILMEDFNLAHFSKVYEENRQLVDEAYEVFPEAAKATMKTLGEYSAELFAKRRAVLKVA